MTRVCVQDCDTSVCEHGKRKHQCKVTTPFNTPLSRQKCVCTRIPLLIQTEKQDCGTVLCEYGNRKDDCKVGGDEGGCLGATHIITYI